MYRLECRISKIEEVVALTNTFDGTRCQYSTATTSRLIISRIFQIIPGQLYEIDSWKRTKSYGKTFTRERLLDTMYLIYSILFMFNKEPSSRSRNWSRRYRETWNLDGHIFFEGRVVMTQFFPSTSAIGIFWNFQNSKIHVNPLTLFRGVFSLFSCKNNMLVDLCHWHY